MSDEDAVLVIRLMQEDAQAALSTSIGKGKQVQGSETDAQIALNLFLAELETAETSFNDRRMTRSILEAVQADDQAICQCQQEEEIAQADRNITLALSRGENAPGEIEASQGNPTVAPEDEFIEKLSCIYNTGISHVESDNDVNGNDDALHQAESSSWAASRQPRKTRHCEACRDEKHFAELARAPCQHEYCGACLTRIFQNATNDESLFPPRCCKQTIPLTESLVFLEANIVQEFRQKALEYSTPRRTYCHSNECNKFIPPTNYANDIATCDQCGSQTCMLCKGASHINDCPNDEQLQQVLRLGQEQLWQRCQNCWALVELNVGCNHMTCRCGHQFCYICGAQWKTCLCQHWDEARLLQRAVQIDARDHRDPGDQGDPGDPGDQGDHGDPVPVDPHEAAPRPGALRGFLEEADQLAADLADMRIRDLLWDLQDNHECDHDRWFSRRGPQECEECGDRMPIFIYECRQCHIMACRSCRYHRL
ncbi:hypothetical protein F5Y06DRAFT_306679 [Hypoxylon sp. FL0890]|nr:hypothetical protein F5Y06DRAFT_306679 [Hypoxylon sp. FL0890]